MTERVLFDVDVAWKVCAYSAAQSFINATGTESTPSCMLAVTPFVLRSLSKRQPGVDSAPDLDQQVDDLISNAGLVNPTPEEIAFAEDLEERAARLALEFDVGESQLLSVLVHRNAELLLTGDKRAIRAMHVLDVSDIDGRIAALEQVFATMIGANGLSPLRDAVCANPRVDRAMTICFACASPTVTAGDVNAALASYVRNLRAESGDRLYDTLDFSAIVP